MKNNLKIISIFIATILLTLTFSCKKDVPKVIPTLTTTAISSITSTTATGGGSISNDGGATVTARGVCWSLNQSPKTSDSKTSDGGGIGNFASSITGLSPGGTYYARAYAINAVGTAYGNQVTITTLSILPTLTTTALTAVTSTTASGGGNITNDGGSAVTARGVCWSSSQNPTIINAKTTDATGSGVFTSSITGLTANTIYYVKAYATNAIGTSYGSENSVILYINFPGPNVTDIDGNLYHSVKIGSQIWTVENLKTTKYRNGNLIGTTTPDTLNISTESSPKYQWANEGKESSVATYGRLYTWYAVNDIRGICPAGWHVSSKAEWTTLSTFLGGESVAGGELKEIGMAHWYWPNTGATNNSGFTALPNGTKFEGGPFNLNSYWGHWWASTDGGLYGWYVDMYCQSINVTIGNTPKRNGLGIRCLMD